MAIGFLALMTVALFGRIKEGIQRLVSKSGFWSGKRRNKPDFKAVRTCVAHPDGANDSETENCRRPLHSFGTREIAGNTGDLFNLLPDRWNNLKQFPANRAIEYQCNHVDLARDIVVKLQIADHGSHPGPIARPLLHQATGRMRKLGR